MHAIVPKLFPMEETWRNIGKNKLKLEPFPERPTGSIPSSPVTAALSESLPCWQVSRGATVTQAPPWRSWVKTPRCHRAKSSPKITKKVQYLRVWPHCHLKNPQCHKLGFTPKKNSAAVVFNVRNFCLKLIFHGNLMPRTCLPACPT